MSLAVIMGDDRGSRLARLLKERLPSEAVTLWPGIGNPEGVRFAVVWKHPARALDALTGLEAVMSYGAGVDFLLADPVLRDIPVGRLVDPDLGQQIAGYVVAHVTALARDFAGLAVDQRAGQWRAGSRLVRPKVGILGLGSVGRAVAVACRTLGYDVAAWTRRPRDGEIRCRHGRPGLLALATESDFLVSTLPATGETRELIDRSVFAAMRPDATIINVGRGECLVEDDLLTALDRGNLGRAVLDVFATEPLPDGHPFWSHPRVTVTPHVAGLTDPLRAADIVARNYRHFIATGELPDAVNRAAGY
ncbi:MAG: glyoxylate/hydroxypyruvate reductase A [Pseudomonadota bacterium]